MEIHHLRALWSSLMNADPATFSGSRGVGLSDLVGESRGGEGTCWEGQTAGALQQMEAMLAWVGCHAQGAGRPQA